jgi:hypothetical protein
MNNQNAGKLKDINGIKYGRLTVIRRSQSNSKTGNAMWICECDCGNIVTVIGSKLRSGYTKSCGCLRISNIAQGHSRERIYVTWKGMHQRCCNPDHDKYKWYGEKGITICDEWHDFIVFREWAFKNGYTDNLTIDRINPDDNYNSNNCQWVDMKYQANNRTNNRIIEYEGKEYSVAQFADMLTVPYHTVRNQMRLGWSIEKIVNRANRRLT